MENYLTTKQHGQQDSIITSYGDDLWGEITDSFSDRFTLSDIARLPLIAHLSPRYRYDIARVIMLNVIAETGEGVVRRIGHSYYWSN